MVHFCEVASACVCGFVYGCVCACVECAVAHFRVAGGAILGALRADRSALYPYMAYHGASPYLREVPPLIFVYSLGIGNTYGGPRSWLCGRASVPHSPESVGVGCGWWVYNSLVINILIYTYINSWWPCFNTRCSNWPARCVKEKVNPGKREVSGQGRASSWSRQQARASSHP